MVLVARFDIAIMIYFMSSSNAFDSRSPGQNGCLAVEEERYGGLDMHGFRIFKEMAVGQVVEACDLQTKKTLYDSTVNPCGTNINVHATPEAVK